MYVCNSIHTLHIHPYVCTHASTTPRHHHYIYMYTKTYVFIENISIYVYIYTYQYAPSHRWTSHDTHLQNSVPSGLHQPKCIPSSRRVQPPSPRPQPPFPSSPSTPHPRNKRLIIARFWVCVWRIGERRWREVWMFSVCVRVLCLRVCGCGWMRERMRGSVGLGGRSHSLVKFRKSQFHSHFAQPI